MIKHIVVIGYFLLFSQNGFSIDINKELPKMKIMLLKKGVDIRWLDQNLSDHHFKLYYKIERYFNNMAEHKVKRNEKDLDWYKRHFGADEKVVTCKDFIANNRGILQKIEGRHNIHKELIVAIMSMETNLGDKRSIGNFYVFSSLVSQFVFIPKRRDFSIRELYALYLFSTKINKSVYYFVGSFAGACGLGQFIPSSLLSTFIDTNGNDLDIDIYAIDDNLASIENYLYEHGLSVFNMSDYNSRYDAVYSYNNSSAYTKTVLYIYDRLRDQE